MCWQERRLSKLFDFICSESPNEFRKTLLEDKSVIDIKHDGTYLLHKACKEESADIVTFLLFSNADCTIPDSKGYYPQHYASRAKSGLIMDIISVFGQDLNVKDAIGNTPLHYAVIKNRKNIVKMLMNHKVKILKNNNGLTPIDICGNDEILKMMTN